VDVTRVTAERRTVTPTADRPVPARANRQERRVVGAYPGDIDPDMLATVEADKAASAPPRGTARRRADADRPDDASADGLALPQRPQSA